MMLINENLLVFFIVDVKYVYLFTSSIFNYFNKKLTLTFDFYVAYKDKYMNELIRFLICIGRYTSFLNVLSMENK